MPPHLAPPQRIRRAAHRHAAQPEAGVLRRIRSCPGACPAPEKHPGQSLRPARGRRSCAGPAKRPSTGARPRVVQNPAASRGPCVSLLLSYPQKCGRGDAESTRLGRKKFEASGASELRLGWNGEAAGEPHTWQPIDCSGISHRGHCSPEITLVPIIKQLTI